MDGMQYRLFKHKANWGHVGLAPYLYCSLGWLLFCKGMYYETTKVFLLSGNKR